MCPLKDRIKHKTNIVYKGTCSCNESYIGETKCDAEIRWKEHCSKNDKKSEVAEHLLKNPGHTIDWQVITSAPQPNNGRSLRPIIQQNLNQASRINLTLRLHIFLEMSFCEYNKVLIHISLILTLYIYF